MIFDIETFKAAGLKQGGARPSLFQVQMNNVPGTNGVIENQQQISFLAQAATLPESQVDPIEVPYFGRRIKVAGERVFRDWTISVLNDEDFIVRDLFERWSNLINTMETNVTLASSAGLAVNPLLGYKCDGVRVNQYSKGGPAATDTGSEDAIIRSYQFFGMFPARVDDIRLDWSQGQAIETYNVVLSYDYWLPVNIGQSTPGFTGLEPGSGPQFG